MIARTALLALCAIHSTGTFANLLLADGLLRTLGVERSSVRLTVVPEFSEPYPVQQRGGRFELELPYHAHYVLRAESPGCATKEVVFNVNLPVHLNGVEREFPLEILMERMADDAPYRYAGPVGLVYFDEAREDFVYTTEHHRIHEHRNVVLTMHRSEGIADDGAWSMAIPSPDPVGDPLALRLPHLTLGRASVAATSTNTSTAHERIRMVGGATYEPAPQVTPKAEEPEAPEVGQRATEPTGTFESVKAIPTATVVENNAVREHREPPPSPASVATPATTTTQHDHALRSGTPPGRCGTTERLHLPRCIVTVDHLSTGHGCVELRKAEHAYGAVFYFHNGRSVTEQHYRQLLDTRASH